MKQASKILKYFVNHIFVIIGLIMIWRGIWYILDGIDIWIFGQYNHWTGLLGIVIGLLIIYIPDKDLKEIEKL